MYSVSGIEANANGAAIQKTHYYPFGTALAESTEPDKQPYKYNGKELDDMHGLNLYDYSARYYEGALGRFTSVDPHAESYYSHSPYAYVGNNPIKRIDPTGKDWWTTSDSTQIANFINSVGNGESGYDFSGWEHHTEKPNNMGLLGFDDAAGQFYMTAGDATKSFDANIKPALGADGVGYPGAYVYEYSSEMGGYAYSFAHTLAQRGIFSSLFTDEYAPFNPNYYYDGIDEWAVNPTGRITGEYVDMPFIPAGGGKGGNPLGFKEHRKGKNWQKHSAPRSGGDPASGRYGQTRNNSKGNSNKKYIPPKNPNKRK